VIATAGALGVLGTAVLAAAGSAACSSTKTPPPDVGKPIVVGVTIALTGDLKGTGVPLQNIIKVASQQINAFGGVLGRPVSFEVVDDTTDSANLLQSNVRTLLDEGAVALLGPIGSKQVTAVAAPSVAGLSFQRKIIELSATATSPDLTTFQPARDRYFFRTVPNDNLQGKAAGIFASRGPGGSGACHHLAIVHNDDAYGNPFAAATTAEFKALGGAAAAVTDISIPSDVKASYSTDLAKLPPVTDCLLMVVFPPAGDELVREIRILQTQTPAAFSPGFFMIGTDALFTNEFIVNGRTDKANAASPSVVEGVYGTNPDDSPPTSQYGDFRNLYLAHFNEAQAAADLAGQAANFYDAAILVALAIEQAGTTADPVAIRDALFQVSKGGRSYGPAQLGDALAAIRNKQDVDYTGASGDCDFDDNGDVVTGYIVWHVESGKFKADFDRIKQEELVGQ